MPGSAGNPVKLDHYQMIKEVHWPDEPDEGNGYGFIAILTWQSVLSQKCKPFLARMLNPGQERWNYTSLGGVRGRYIVGVNQYGLGGDYAYASAGRCDPHRTLPDPSTSNQVPSWSTMDTKYLWHCGTNLSMGFESLIINTGRAAADFANPGDTFKAISIQAASLGSGGDVAWQVRLYSERGGSFSINDGKAEYSGALAGTINGVIPAGLLAVLEFTIFSELPIP